MIIKKDIETTYKSIRNDIVKTPLVYSTKLSEISGANVYLKMEQEQYTSSFKLRGVLSKMNSFSEEEFKNTFVAASTGNHAAAFGYASEKFGFEGKLFLPEHVEEEKLNVLQHDNIENILYGKTSMETEAKATAYAKDTGGILIHPYNDIDIIKGQGTIALEIEDQLPLVDTVIAPIGGGGLISGICSYFSENEEVRIIGSQPEYASEMHDSIRIGSIVPPSTQSTIADAAAGGIEKDAITFEICKKHVSEIQLIKEDDIKKAISFLYKYHHITVEPTAALPVATLLKSDAYRTKNVVLVLTGKKINKQLLNEIHTNYDNCY